MTEWKSGQAEAANEDHPSAIPTPTPRKRLYHSWTALFVEIFGEYEVAKLNLLQRALLRDDILDMCRTEPQLAGLLTGESPEWAPVMATKTLRDRIGGAANLEGYVKTLRPERPYGAPPNQLFAQVAAASVPGIVLPPSIAATIAADLDGPLACDKCKVGPLGPDFAGNAGHLFTCEDHPNNKPKKLRFWKSVYVEADTIEEAEDLMIQVDAALAKMHDNVDMDVEWDEVDDEEDIDEDIERHRRIVDGANFTS